VAHIVLTLKNRTNAVTTRTITPAATAARTMRLVEKL
jgi:hypothetical protein